MPSTAASPVATAPIHQGGWGMFPSIASARNHITVCSVAPFRLYAVYPHMRPLTPEEAEEASRHLSLGARAPQFAMRTEYVIPAVEKGSFAVLPVYDTAQYCMTANPSDDVIQMPAPIGCDLVAAALVKDFAHSGVSVAAEGGQCALGVGVIAGDEPTSGEIERLINQQALYFTSLVAAGDEHWMNREFHQIGNINRIAAKWLGVDPEKHEWIGVHMAEMRNVARCLLCGETVKAGAIRCKHCGGDLMGYCIDNEIKAAEIKEYDPELAQRIENRRKSLANKK